MSSGDPRTRERILEKTWQLMERKRGRQVNIDDIASLVGVSRQAIYLHFGSRAGLLIATVRYVDQVKGVDQRVRAVTTASDGVAMLAAFIEFWGNYMPEIDGLARALLAARETDKAASAAWDDRMRALRQGCVSIMRCLAREKRLAPEWTPDQAADALWAMLSIEVWENLTLECAWTNAQYVSRMQAALRRTFTK
jgi:AcrR family transcriptional regulator